MENKKSYDHLKLFIPYVFIKKIKLILILFFTCKKQIFYKIYCRIMTTCNSLEDHFKREVLANFPFIRGVLVNFPFIREVLTLGGALIFSYLILIHQRDTFGGLYDNQVHRVIILNRGSMFAC